MKRLLFIICLLSLTLPLSLSAQEDVAYWGKEDAYLLRQAKYMYELVDEALDEYPPVVGAPTSRKLALYNLDAMLHETKYDNTEPFKSFVASRASKVIKDMTDEEKAEMREKEEFILNKLQITRD